MREARFILPISLATSFAIDITRKAIVTEFGGITFLTGTGWWKEEEPEAVKIFDVAYEPSEDNDRRLYDIAYAFKQMAKQEAVYLRYGNGHVQMVTALSCMDNGEKLPFDWDVLRNELHEPADDMDDTAAVGDKHVELS